MSPTSDFEVAFRQKGFQSQQLDLIVRQVGVYIAAIYSLNVKRETRLTDVKASLDGPPCLGNYDRRCLIENNTVSLYTETDVFRVDY